MILKFLSKFMFNSRKFELLILDIDSNKAKIDCH
jgi:hypothetical protein